MVTQHYPQLGTLLDRGPLTQPVAWSSPPVCLLKFNVDGDKSKGVLNNKKGSDVYVFEACLDQ